ncbi:hypothetical protein NEIELOOT_00826 [Neisseria elongata subsp. glycolytica ATCC 29315]|uniref:Uncharacterized protein n=1 Tax=Neisseria elongata subsp. glycolytica ATCC 29315 TaxID=546263 RepID=D4DP41_NEIEG|nr:hypothetical protein NEIELOOT_00826 [Neisseria elongata subsp. glycolytica ATCC 29315]
MLFLRRNRRSIFSDGLDARDAAMRPSESLCGLCADIVWQCDAIFRHAGLRIKPNGCAALNGGASTI